MTQSSINDLYQKVEKKSCVLLHREKIPQEKPHTTNVKACLALN